MSDSRLDYELKFSMNFNFCQTPSQLSSGYAKTANFPANFPDVYKRKPIAICILCDKLIIKNYKFNSLLKFPCKVFYRSWKDKLYSCYGFSGGHLEDLLA